MLPHGFRFGLQPRLDLKRMEKDRAEEKLRRAKVRLEFESRKEQELERQRDQLLRRIEDERRSEVEALKLGSFPGHIAVQARFIGELERDLADCKDSLAVQQSEVSAASEHLERARTTLLRADSAVRELERLQEEQAGEFRRERERRRESAAEDAILDRWAPEASLEAEFEP